MNQDAFDKLATSELDAVYRLACHLAGSRDADDLVQETYLRAFRSAHTFALGEQGIRPWLFKILHNVVLTRGARQQREREAMSQVASQANIDAPAGHAPADDGSVDAPSSEDLASPGLARIDWDVVDQRLKQAVFELPLNYRVVFLLSAVESLQYKQIAQVIDAPIGTVMSRLSRARDMLAKRLADMARELRIDAARASRPPARVDNPRESSAQERKP